MGQKYAKIAVRNLMKKRTSIGRVERISQNGAAKCGGAVVSEARNNQAVNSQNTKLKTSMKTNSKIRKRRSKKNKNS